MRLRLRTWNNIIVLVCLSTWYYCRREQYKHDVLIFGVPRILYSLGQSTNALNIFKTKLRKNSHFIIFIRFGATPIPGAITCKCYSFWVRLFVNGNSILVWNLIIENHFKCDTFCVGTYLNLCTIFGSVYVGYSKN